MDITQEVEEVKKELAELIITHLRENKLDLPKAQKLASDFLASLPVASHKELLAKLKNLAVIYEEAEEVYVREFSQASEEKDKAAINSMSDLIKKGDIESALNIAKSLQQENKQTV